MQGAIQDLIELFVRFQHKEFEAKAYSPDHRMNEARTLMLLMDAHPQGLKVLELSKELRVSSPFVTQQVNAMEASGLIVRIRDTEDRRNVFIRLTDEGVQSAETVKKHFYELFVGLAHHLGEEDSHRLARLMNRALDYIDDRIFK